MTRRRETTALVPVEPRHRRTWQSLWRRCRCGLPAPCVDRLVPSPPLPFPPRPTRARARPAARPAGPHPRAMAPSGAPRRLPPGARRPRRIASAASAMPQIRRAAPQSPIPRQGPVPRQGSNPRQGSSPPQERSNAQDKRLPTQPDPRPGGTRAKPPGTGVTPLSLSWCSPGGGRDPVRTPPPGDISGSTSRRAEPPSRDGDRANGGGRRGHRTDDGRPGRSDRHTCPAGDVRRVNHSAGGRPAMAYQFINLKPW